MKSADGFNNSSLIIKKCCRPFCFHIPNRPDQTPPDSGQVPSVVVSLGPGQVGHSDVCLTWSSLSLTGELQPMASSTSVASLVIAVETGLSDEEGSMEQSHMGDKSWEEHNRTNPEHGPNRLKTGSGFFTLVWVWRSEPGERPDTRSKPGCTRLNIV